MKSIGRPTGLCAPSARCLAVYMLGPPSVQWQGSPLVIARRQARALIYRLAAGDTPVPRDHLAFLFWPDVCDTVARANLSRLLNLVRSALPHPDLLLADKNQVRLNPDLVWSDTRQFARLHALAARGNGAPAVLHQAADLYRDSFLAGFSLPGSPEFDLWLTREQQHWERQYLKVLDALIDLHTRRHEYQQAIACARRYLDVDELAESVHRRLIRLYAAVGDRGAALRQFETCATILERELGVSPLPETRAAYQAALTGTRAVQVQVPAWTTVPTLEVEMVGRDEALLHLQQAYTTTRRGQGRVVFVSGEPGIGKSRLLQEFIARLEPPTRVLVGNAHEGEQGIPYGPLVEALRAHINHLDWASLNLAPETLATIADLLPPVRDHLPPPSSEPPYPFQSTQLVQALVDLILALAERDGHVVLCMDNMHWADDATRAWLNYLARHVQRAPVLILIAYRSEEVAMVDALRAEAERLGILEDIPLSRLAPEEVRYLVHVALSNSPVPPALVERLHRDSGGNPFFLLELVRTLVETGGRWPEGADVNDRRGEGGAWSPPATVWHAIDARLARLSPRDRQVLETVAVLGSNAFFDFVHATSGREESEVVQALDALVARHILVEQEERYAFAHDLIRSRVYHCLGRGRRLLHRRAGQVLERTGATDAITLARHFEQGGDPTRAIRYYLQAGDRARDLYACREAVRHYERALILQREQGDEEGAARTLMRLGLTHHMALAFEPARRAYNEGFRIWQRCATRSPQEVLPPAPHALRVDWPHVLTLDPVHARDANSGGVIDQLFSGLVEWSPSMNLVPDMAQGWEITDGGRRYLIHLRQDVRWSDGRPVTAHDFEYAWKRVLAPGSHSPHASLLYVIESARAYHQQEGKDASHVRVCARDAATLEVILSSPCSYFLHLLAHPITRPVPRHVVEAWGDAWATPPHLVTNGPFRLVDWQWARTLTLAREPGYRGRTSGNVEEVILHLMVTLEAKAVKLRMFEEDRLDVLGLWWGIPPAHVAHLLRRHGGELVSGLNLFVRYVAFDVSRPPFDDVRVRRAFAHAVDRRTLAYVILAGYDDPALGGLIPPGMPGYSPNAGLAYDPQRARALLADAGYRGGRGFPPIAFSLPQGFEALGEYLRDGWQRVLGITVRLEMLPWEAYLARVQGADRPPVFLKGWVARYPDADTFLRASNFRALTGWQHREYEALVRRAGVLPDHDERLRLYRQADALLMQEAPIVPILYARRNFLLKPWVRTFPISPLKWWFWKDVVLFGHAAT